jgi:hypothetical protein
VSLTAPLLGEVTMVARLVAHPAATEPIASRSLSAQSFGESPTLNKDLVVRQRPNANVRLRAVALHALVFAAVRGPGSRFPIPHKPEGRDHSLGDRMGAQRPGWRSPRQWGS